MLRHFSPSAHWTLYRCILQCDRPSRSPPWACWTAPGSSTASFCGGWCGSAGSRSQRSDIRKDNSETDDLELIGPIHREDRTSQTHLVTFALWPAVEINWRIPESRKSEGCARTTGSETLHFWYICLSVSEADWSLFKGYKLVKQRREREQESVRHWPAPDQSASSWIRFPRWARFRPCSWAPAALPQKAWHPRGSAWAHGFCILRKRTGRHGSQSTAYCSPETTDSPSAVSLSLQFD